MDFHLSDDQRVLQRTLRDFAAREIAPHVMEWDEAQTWPADVVAQLGQMGMMGVLVPVVYGGSGLGYVEYALAIAELARVDGSVGLIVAAHNSLCVNHL